MSIQKLTEWTKKKRRRDAVEPHHLPVEDREFNFKEVNLGYLSQDEIFVEAGRCYTCRKPACEEACPASFNIRDMLVNIQNGHIKTAADIVNDFYCFSESFNRICPAKCQEACIAGKKGDPINILNIKRYLAENFNKPENYYKVPQSTGMKVAIIGSGPSGVTAARELVKSGHKVTIFEKHDVLGGMLAIGIPEYRLPIDILQREIKDLEKLGIEIKTGITYGTDISERSLKDEGYHAILIAHGAHNPKWMNIPCEDKKGVIHAIDFLRNQNLGKSVNIGQNVIVVGGGDVAIDAVRVATRLGSDASIVYRRSKEQMPATTEEIEETENEGIPIHYLTNPIEIIGDTEVESVKLIKMKLGEPDSSGRRSPIPIEGSEFIIDVDTVIMAISQEPEHDYLESEDIPLTPWNTIDVNGTQSILSKEGMFAAGDNVTGPKTAIEAIVQGKDAAEEINEYLKTFIPTPLPDPFSIE